jgi:HEAT repeat protein
MKYTLLLFAICGATFAADTNSDEAWDVLRKGLADKSIGARVQAANALGAIYHDPQAQAEAEKLLDDASPKVRAAAALALGNMDARSSANKITALFDSSSFSEVFAAAAALRQLEDPRASRVYYATLTGQKKTGEGLIESQLKILRDPKAIAQMSFDQGIGLLPYAGSVLTAYEMITKDDVSPLRGEAALWLAYDPDPRSAIALTEALADKKWIVRAAAAEAIGQRDDPALKENLPPLFYDPEDAVRFASAAAYLRLASPNLEEGSPARGHKHQSYRRTRDEELLHRLSKFLHSF